MPTALANVAAPLTQLLALLVPIANGLVATCYKAEKHIANMKKRLTSIAADVAFEKRALQDMAAISKRSDQILIGIKASVERLGCALLLRLSELRTSVSLMVIGLGTDLSLFGLPMVGGYLKKMEVPSDEVEMAHSIVHQEDPDNVIEVSLYSEAPFLVGECTTELYSASQIHRFLDKVASVKRAVGRETEEPMLFFFAGLVNDESVKQAAIRQLEEAGCHWLVSGDFSKDF